MLEGLPLGQWRLDTRGEYGPMDVRGLQGLLDGCHLSTALLRATMRLEARTSHVMVRGEKLTHHYSLVVIEPSYTPEALLVESARAQQRQLAAPSEETKTAAAHIADLFGDDPRGSTIEVPAGVDKESGKVLSPSQTPTELERATNDPGANQPHLHHSAWHDTLEAHKDDPALDDGLRAKVKLALNPASNTGNAKGLALASAVLDCIDNPQEP